MADPAEDYLRTLNTSQRVRAAAWDAVYAADDADAQQRLAQLPFSQDVKADLWEIRNGASVSGGSAPTPARAEDFMDAPSAAPDGSALRRFVVNAGEQLNPVAAVKGVVNAVRHPVETATNLWNAQADQFAKARELYQQGRGTEAAGHLAAGVIPVIGPAAAAAGEQMASGDVAGGLGAGVGLMAATVGPRARTVAKEVVQGASRLAPKTAARVATVAEQGAAARVADVMSPKVGPNKTRFGNKAERVAPQLAKDLATDGAPWTREGFHAQVSAKLEGAKAGLEQAADARLAGRAFETQPILDDLVARRRALTAEAVDGSRVARVETERTSPILDARGGPISVTEPRTQRIGHDVVPQHNRVRVAEIDRAIQEVQALGPLARYESLRRIRQSYDGPAETVYSPSMTADYLKAQGGKLGAADVSGVLREHLARFDPDTAAANAEFSLYKNSADVLEATREVERTRPRVGRLIANRIFGTVTGGQAAGTAGAVAGYVGAPLLDAGTAMGATTKLKVAALQQQLATAIRQANVQQVNVLASRLERELASVRRASRTVPIQAQQVREAATTTAGSPEDRPPALAQGQ